MLIPQSFPDEINTHAAWQTERKAEAPAYNEDYDENSKFDVLFHHTVSAACQLTAHVRTRRNQRTACTIYIVLDEQPLGRSRFICIEQFPVTLEAVGQLFEVQTQIGRRQTIGAAINLLEKERKKLNIIRRLCGLDEMPPFEFLTPAIED
jgi:hypothetical protein